MSFESSKSSGVKKEEFDEQFLIIPEEKNKDVVLDSEYIEKTEPEKQNMEVSEEEKNKKIPVFENVEKNEKSLEKSELEIIGEKLIEINKAIDCIKKASKDIELISKNTKKNESIDALKMELEKIEKEKEVLEIKYKVLILEKRLSDLEGIIKNQKTGELGLTENEAKEASDEMKKQVKEISSGEEIKKDSKTEPVKIENVAVKISPELSRMDSNIAALEAEIEAARKGLSSSTVDVRMMNATLAQLKKERAAMAGEKTVTSESPQQPSQERPNSSEQPVSSAEPVPATSSEQFSRSENPEGKKDILPSSASGLFKETYEKNKKKEEGKSKWGWIKERLKGLATVGFWEFHQAERFRSKTKETASDITVDAKKIQQTEVLDLESALEEALEMKSVANKENKYNLNEISKGDLDRYSNAITERKREENSSLINTIVNQSTENLERQLAKYKDEFGDSAVTNEKLDAFRNRLRGELESLQRGFIFKEELDGKGELSKNRPSKVREAILANPEAFKKTIRESLDPKWWKRYVYGGAEMALWATAGAVSTYNYLYGTKAVGAKIAKDATVEAGSSIVENMNMKDTIWNTSKEWLQQNGISNPNNADIMNVSKQVATDNGIGVQEWGLKGNPMDTNMQQGHILKFGGASKVLNAIKIARGISAVL